MEERKATILVVDDEAALIDVLKTYLEDDGFTVLHAGDGREAVRLAAASAPDLILLDLNLPKLPGLEAFREIRAQRDTPVIMVTARGAEVDRVVGLELGADDYIAKPYSPREVVARVKTVLRRQRASLARPENRRVAHDVRQVGTLSVDLTSHEVRQAGKSVKVTPTEYRLLSIFLAHPGQVFTRDHLIELVTRDGGEIFDRTLDRHIANLRAKIEPDSQRPAYILTVYGAGYKLADPA